VCLHWDWPQGVCESLARPALSCRSKEGWGTGLRFLCRACPEVSRHSVVGHQPQGQCESLARPVLSCRSKEGWGTGLRFVDRWQLLVFKMNLAIQMKQGSPSWRADKSCLRKLTPLTQSTQSTQSSHLIQLTHSTHSALLTLPLSLLSLKLSLSLSLKRVSLFLSCTVVHTLWVLLSSMNFTKVRCEGKLKKGVAYKL
jgi:hypothetical protein